jgi:hypothetical protein
VRDWLEAQGLKPLGAKKLAELSQLIAAPLPPNQVAIAQDRGCLVQLLDAAVQAINSGSDDDRVKEEAFGVIAMLLVAPQTMPFQTAASEAVHTALQRINEGFDEFFTLHIGLAQESKLTLNIMLILFVLCNYHLRGSEIMELTGSVDSSVMALATVLRDDFCTHRR